MEQEFLLKSCVAFPPQNDVNALFTNVMVVVEVKYKHSYVNHNKNNNIAPRQFRKRLERKDLEIKKSSEISN